MTQSKIDHAPEKTGAKRNSASMNEAGRRNWPEVIAELSSGFMLLDFTARTLLWQNQAMRNLFAAPPPGYEQTEEYFFSEFPPAPPGKPVQKAIEVANRTIGFTVHFVGGGLGLVLAADISEQIRQRQAGEVSTVMDALDNLFFNLAHEIGNPINSIKMTLEVLITNFQSYSRQTQLEYLGNLNTEFTRLEELLKAIRSFNDFEYLTVQPTDIRALLQDLAQMMKGEIDEQKIDLILSFTKKPAWAACDPRALQHSLLHVIGNAMDALNGRGHPVIAISIEADESSCRVRIRDNGSGIPEEKVKEVFLPFHSSKPHRAGLGLTMVRKLLTRMNGTIEINCLQREGTEVVFTLPAAPPHGH